MSNAVTEIPAKLLAWYDAHRRDLPWRATRDPFHILVAEIMLQQTQVDRVVPKYREFVARFPTPAALAAVPLGEVIRAWAPLGYNRRAVRLHAIARAIAERGGQVPVDVDALLRLDGIGQYTAAAVAAIAFGQPVTAVDTNVRRVLGRLLFGRDDAPVGQVRSVAATLVPTDRAGDWNQALMDLGSTVCAARRPDCSSCPLHDLCAYAAVPRQLRERGPIWQAPPPRAAAPFVGSRRYFRGRIVERLRALAPGETIAAAELAREAAPDCAIAWFAAILESLEADGLIRLEDDGGERRVALP